MLPWQLVIVIIFVSLIVLMTTGLPMAFCFLAIDIIGVFIWWGGMDGLNQMIISLSSSLREFSLVPLPLFILMGEVMFHAGIAPRMIDALGKWMGNIPGRLSYLTVAAGTVLASITGASMAAVAMLGEVLFPEMEKRGYHKAMSIGPILGSGGLAIMIPPSSLAVVYGSIAEVSVGKILIAIIMPGLLMAAIYVIYIWTTAKVKPKWAPQYEVESAPFGDRFKEFAKYVLPLGLIVFLVVGVIFTGTATPTEAAATGCTGCFILAAVYRKLNWKVVKKSFASTLRTTAMMLFILAAAKAFSQILAYSGASSGLSKFAVSLPVPPMAIFWAMQIVVLILGMFINVVSIMMVTLPVFVPIVAGLHFDPVWFAVVYLINTEIAGISPPFGLSLFVMKDVAGDRASMSQIVSAGLPYCGLAIVAMALISVFPLIASWLPSIMQV